MGVPIPLDDIPDELLPGDPIPLDDIPDEFVVDEPAAPTAGPLRGRYLPPPVVLSEVGPYSSGYQAPPIPPPPVLQERPQRVSQPRPQNAPRDMSAAFSPYGDYFSQQHEGAPLPDYDDSLASDVARRASELFIDPIVRGYRQTAQASNVFTGDTPVESLESAAHDIAERERQARSAPKADYMVAAEEEVKQIVQGVMTPDQIQRQYERRQYQDDLENGVDPKPFIPHPGYPGEAEQRQAEADLASAFGGGDAQVQQSEYNLPGDPPGMPPVIGLTPAQKAEAVARMTGVYLKDPRRAINVSLESLTSSSVGLGLGFGLGAAGGSVAGVPGAMVGGAAGLGSGSFLAEYGADVLDQMRQDGIDISNEQVVLRLLSDPDYMERVKAHARNRGAAIASFDALSGALGGRVAGPVTRALEDAGKVSSKLGQQATKIGGEAAEILTQGALGGTGEAAGALAGGDPVDPEAVAQEIVGEGGSGISEILSGRYADQRAEEAYRNSPEGRADETRERALSSALDLTSRIRASSPPADTMPPPALTGSRASDAAGGTGTAPIPPAAQGTATTLQDELAPGTIFRAPDGDYAVVASSPNPDPEQHFLGLRGPDGELRPWTVSEFAAHIQRQQQLEQEPGRQEMVRGLRDMSAALRDREPQRQEMVQGLRQMSESLRDPEPARKEKARTEMVQGLRNASEELRSPEPRRKAMVKGLAEKSGKLRSQTLEQIENEKLATQLERQADTLDKAGTPGFSAMAQEHRQKARELRGQEQVAPPAPPAPTEPAPTPAPAEKAVSTTQEPPAGVATPTAPAARPAPAVEEPAPTDEEAEKERAADEEARKKSVADEKAKHKAIKKEYRQLRKSDPEFKRVADLVGDEPQYADLGMLQGWKDAKAGVPITDERAKEMMPTKDMKPHGFNPVQRYLTGYAAALGLNPHDLRATDVPDWLIKVYEHQTGEKVFDDEGEVVEQSEDIGEQAAEAVEEPPMKATREPIPPAQDTPMFTGRHPVLTDKRETVITAAGTKVDTAFQVIEAADLITSDNPKFPQQYQPRERGKRAVSQEQIAKIAGNIDPEQLGSNRHAEHGAPIIGRDDNYVESGNGRVMALRQMYARSPEAAAKYREFVARESGTDVSGMKAPILVRRRITEMTPQERAKFTKEANKTAVAKMSAAEQAKVDQEMLTPDVMSKLPDESSEAFDLAKGEGTKFVSAFVSKFTPAERGELVDADGKPSVIAVNRAKAALLSKAYGGTPGGDAAIRRAVESTSTDAQTLINTLVRFAAPFAKLREDIDAGRVQDQADIGPKIAEAIEVVRHAGTPAAVTEWLNTEDMLDPKDDTVKQLIQTFYSFDGRGNVKRLRTGGAIGATLSEYLTLARQFRPEQAGGGLFGDEGAAPVLNPAAELGRLNEARKTKEQTREREEAGQAAAQGGLFTAGGQPSAAVSARPRDAESGEDAQSAGPRARRIAGGSETPSESDQADFLTDELRRPKRRKSKRQPGPYSMTREGEIRASANEQIWTDAGLDPDMMALATPPEQFRRAAEIVKKRFGFRDIAKANNLNWGEAIDALKDAYVGLSNLAAIQQLNPGVMSLNGRLALSLEREHSGALAYYQPGTKTIGMTRRNDAFAHEWAHALDHYLVETFAPEMLAVKGRHLTGKTRAGGVAETMDEQVRDAYIAVLNAMYFDSAKAAAYVADIEKKVATAKTDKQRLKFQTQLDNFRMGHSKKGGIESEYYEAAKAMDSRGPEGSGDHGYWQRPTEMFARSYEAYIGNKLGGLPAQHPFVTQSRRMYDENRIGTMTVPYPQEVDRTNIFAALDTLMRAMRDRSYVDSGNAPALIDPTDTRYWKKAAPALPPKVAQQGQSVTQRLLAPFKRQLAEAHRADRDARQRAKQDKNIRDVKLNQRNLSGRRRWLANMGMSAWDNTKALPEMLAHTIRGMLLAIEERHAGNTGIEWLRGKFATDPGSGRFTGAVWSEEVRHWEKTYQNRFADIVKKHDLRGYDDAQLRQLRDVLVNAIPQTSVPTNVARAAADMRRFLNDMYAYNANNGVNIGYAKNGYLPRIIDALIVENNVDGFRTQARILYARVYPKEIGTLDSILSDPLEHPEGLKNIIQYVKEIAKSGRVPQAKDAARQMVDDARELEKALAELKEASENGDDTAELEERIAELGEALYDGLRDPWAMEAAYDWEARIRDLGAEPEFAFEKRGPGGSYMKSRVLPPETDEIMGDYLKNDPLELISTYINQSVRRVEFGKFFGNEGKNQKLGWKLDAALHSARLPYRAKDGTTQRVTQDEFEELQKSIDLLVGRYNTNMTRKGLRWRMKLTALMTPVILARSLRSQLAEPFVTSRKTGNLSDGFRVFYQQMQDVAAKVGIKGAKQKAAWRREMAEYFGIVADHTADQIMLQRYNLMDLNSSDRVKMARFFQIIGVHPHAMSMRRAVAQIFMTRYAPRMAERAMAGGTKGKLALQALAELGIDVRSEGMLAELAQLSDVSDVAELDAMRNIDAIRTAINRFVDSAIQNPSAIDKPRLASMPEYSFMYGILSFQFAYQRNILVATAKEIRRTWQQDKAMGAMSATSAALSFSLIAGGQLAAWIAGMALFGDEDWDEIEEKIDDQWLMQSLSRSGMYGAADPIVNSFLGLKYERDLTSVTAGPIPATVLGIVQDVGKAILSESEANTASHKAVEASWKAASMYASSKVLAIAGGNPYADAALGVGLMFLSSPAVSDWVADTLVGDTNKELKDAASKGDAEADAELQERDMEKDMNDLGDDDLGLTE